MGFFSRIKKQVTTAKAKATGPAPVNRSTGERKEPLLEPVPGDELPGWTDVDGTKTGNRADAENPESGDTDTPLPPYYRERAEATLFLQKLWTRLVAGTIWLLGCGGAITTVKLALWAAGAAALLTTALLTAPAPIGRNVNVAFIGNSYFFVNDLPRLMEAVTGGHMYQDSCLHGSGSLLNILKTGNGMYYKWQSQNAMKGGVEWASFDGSGNSYLYDYGACSVPQLLTGKDDMLSYQNQYGHYINDGTNPCLVDADYLDWQTSKTKSKQWDFVVMVDQSKRMAFDDARQEALMGLNYTYGPLLERKSAVPILVQPHAFWSEQVNMTGLSDVPTFTSLIQEGAQIYRDFLNEKLGHKKTRIAPVGNAFLAVYEEDKDLWAKLFLDDGIHPSAHGSYLYAMVIHASMYKAVPPKGRVVNKNVGDLFANARKMHSESDMMPTKQEAKKLWKIARKVAVHGHKPRSLKHLSGDYEYVEETDDEIEETEEDEYYSDQPDADDAVRGRV
jgi:hypothetical protein